MLNFTEEIKNEITAIGFNDKCCKKAALSAFIRTSGSIISRGGNFGFELITENEKTAEFFFDMLESAFNLNLTVSEAKFDVLSGKDKLTFECVNEHTTRLLKELYILGEENGEFYLLFGIDERLISNDCCKEAFIKGAFLGGGSCTLPEKEHYSRTGYHLENVFSNKITASDFCDLLCDFEILSKCVSRKDNAVVYVKSKEVISDYLNVLNVPDSLKKLNKIVQFKDDTNNANRINNCSVSNIDKSLTASANLVHAIQIIKETVGLQTLAPQLFEVAAARLADKSASMQELANRLGISKSCINHRIRKIQEIASALEND
ncbi:MAG: DNA-binding protein WhiA [Clostridiales bacterium]|nr:DNA-binding protein WhiA [Clostridiales bacterium]